MHKNRTVLETSASTNGPGLGPKVSKIMHFRCFEQFFSMYPLQKSQEITVLTTPASANAKTLNFELRTASANSCVAQRTRSSKIARICPEIVRDLDFYTKMTLFWRLLRRPMARGGSRNSPKSWIIEVSSDFSRCTPYKNHKTSRF